MDSQLQFTTDGELRKDDQVLARVLPSEDGAFGRVVSSAHEYEIVRLRPNGWHFHLLDRHGEHGEFLPFRLRRGGRLRLGAEAISLGGRALHHGAWSFSTQDDRQIHATAKHARRGECKASADFEVALEAEDSIGALPASGEALAFGCWLIVQWQQPPSAGHGDASAVLAFGLGRLPDARPSPGTL